MSSNAQERYEEAMAAYKAELDAPESVFSWERRASAWEELQEARAVAEREA